MRCTAFSSAKSLPHINKMDRVILHCDCNSFFASCEITKNPDLKNVPMAVCGDPSLRHGIILAKNDLAKKYGVTTAETVWAAKSKCPSLVLVKGHYDLYSAFSKRCNAIYKEYTDMVEPFGIDESWLDVTGSRLLFGDGKKIADEIRTRFKRELGITCSVGVSFNKTLAKLGSDYKKPDATTVFGRNELESIVWKMDVADLLFVGKNTAAALRKMNILTIGDLAIADRKAVTRKLGKAGEMLIDYANGIDDSPVEYVDTEHEPKSISNGMTFKRDLVTEEDFKKGIMLVADEVTSRLKRHSMKYTTLSLTVKYGDFTIVQKQKHLDYATNLMSDTVKLAQELFNSLYDKKRSVRSITIGGSSLVPADKGFEQLSFLSTPCVDRVKQASLEKTVEDIRKKYGNDAVSLGTIMNTDDL